MNLDTIPIEFVTSERITIDYHTSASKIKQVFPKHFREPSVRRFHEDRKKISDKLLMYNQAINAPDPVLRNIQSLRQPETYAIITGQQPGIFSGPLYTVYKAVSTIVLCKKLYDGKHSFVPIFWNASEDHDLSEVNNITMFEQNNPFKIQYDSESTGTTFARIGLNKTELKEILSTIERVSPNSEFKAPLIKDLDKIIENSSTIGDFFSRFMVYLFGDMGLVLIEPQNLRELMVPIFETLVRRPTECTKILNQSGSELEKLGYSPKIHKKLDVCNFFILDDEGKRMQVTYDGNFQFGSQSFSQTELLRLLDDDPLRFSANAVTRSITQDFLFPTFAYVAGPNEIAYLAQLAGIYDFFSIEMPVIFPRFGATIVETKISKVLDKYKVGTLDLKNPERLLKTLAREKINHVFNAFRNQVTKGMDDVTRKAESIDKTLVPPCSLARGRILRTIEVLEDKVTSRLKEYDSVARRQIIKANHNLFPYEDLQERQTNVLEYLVKFGKTFLRNVYENFFEADYGEHKVIRC